MRVPSPCAPRGERFLVAEGSQCGERGGELYSEHEENKFKMLVLFETAAGYAIFKVSIFITLLKLIGCVFFCKSVHRVRVYC